MPKMKRALITTLMVFMGVTGVAYAQSYRMELSVSNNAIFGALDAKHFVSRGYMRAGIDGIYSDEDDEDYKILNPKMLVGSETLYPGLQCELGFRGIIGTAEKGDDKGNMGGVGFAGNVAFTFPQSQHLPYSPNSLPTSPVRPGRSLFSTWSAISSSAPESVFMWLKTRLFF